MAHDCGVLVWCICAVVGLLVVCCVLHGVLLWCLSVVYSHGVLIKCISVAFLCGVLLWLLGVVCALCIGIV